MDSLTIILTILASFVVFLYFILSKNRGYWESRGIKCRKNQFPFGSVSERLLMKISFHEFIQQFYEEMKGNKVAGLYEGIQPMLYILDPELIKLVLVKHFDHFTDRPFVRFKSEGCINKIMIALRGAEWKRARVACTPAFSSGRLKAMVPLFNACSKQMVDYLNTVTKEKGTIEYDIRSLIIHYTLDAIASTAFGINLDSFSDKESEFVRKALEFQNVSVISRIIMVLCVMYQVPEWITSRLPLTFFNKDSVRFFTKTLIETRNYRKKNNVRRNDLLQLLLDAEAAPVEVIGEVDQEISNEKRELLDEITSLAQSVLFFLAGFETSSIQLSMICYELAKNKDIQDKVRQDILEHWNDNENLTYEAITSMQYLDMAMSETLRMYPALARLERMVTKPITLDGLKLEYGTKIMIPISGLQHDPTYYPDPMQFKPERFSPEEKAKRPQYTYLAFGGGPRNCIGLRFATISSKICISHLLKHFEIDICDRTPIPFKYDTRAFFLKSKDDIYLKLTRISE